MLIGPPFSRAAFESTLHHPLQAGDFVIRPAAAEDAPLIADLLNADSYDLQKEYGWGRGAHIDSDEVREDILPMFQKHDETNDQIGLHIFASAGDKILGEVRIYKNGTREFPFINIYLLPSARAVETTQTIFKAMTAHFRVHGLIARDTDAFPRAISDAFTKAANPAIETQRLLIRPYNQDDKTAIKTFLRHRYAGVAGMTRQIKSPENAYYHLMERAILLENCLAGIFTKKNGRLIGELTFWSDTAQRPRMTYLISPQHRGKGYACEAHQAALAWADQVLPSMPLTFAEVETDNTASIKILEKSGFQAAGIRQSETPSYEDKSIIVLERPRP